MTGLLPDPRLRWPLVAGLTWALAWAALRAAAAAGAPAPLGVLAGLVVAGLPAVFGRRLGVDTPWRRLFIAAGFPLLLVATGLTAGVPTWTWGAALAVLALAYPVSAWRDAPVFPTPREALRGLPAQLGLPPSPRILDAGCGLGHGLKALRDAWPDARLAGVERSWPWRLAAALRCPWARVRQGDMWAGSWAGLDAVYLFQRPESMGRAMAKAEAEMAPGTWLVSLEFEVPGRAPDVSLRPENGRPVHAYRVAMRDRPAGRGTRATRKRLKVMAAVPKQRGMAVIH